MTTSIAARMTKTIRFEYLLQARNLTKPNGEWYTIKTDYAAKAVTKAMAESMENDYRTGCGLYEYRVTARMEK